MTRYITPDNWLALALACASLILALVTIAVYRRRLISVPRCVKRQSDAGLPDRITYPSVSVIVYSFNNAKGLEELIPQLRRQNYPGKFDIIVVNDGKDDATEGLLNRMSTEDVPRLYHTFTPRDTRNLSRKKLALTLGIKAAAGDCIINVTADTRVHSDNWLRLMAAPFTDPATEIVIGYAAPDNDIDTARGARGRRHDRLIDSVYYLASALAGKTYRGDGDNLAYRRSLFFANKGFSGSLQLAYGDDDVFISEIADRRNTAVEIGDEAQVATVTEEPAKRFRHKKSRYNFTSKYGKRKRLRIYSLASIALWGWLLASLASIAVAPLNPLSWGINIVTGAALWIPMVMAWSKAAERLNSPAFTVSVIPALMLRPLRDFGYRMHRHDIPEPRFTWETF